MEGGYIKLWRGLKNNAIIQKPDYLSVWIHLLLSVNYAENEFIFNNEKIIIKSGSFITSRSKIAKSIKVQESKVERILKYLEIEQQIEQQAFNKFRIISIVNWSKYQQTEQEIEQPVNSKRTASEQQVNTIKNNKKEKKEKEVINKDLFLDCVLLSAEEVDKLKAKFNGNFDKALAELNNYKMSSGKKYNSDYHALIGWVAKKFGEDDSKKDSWEL